MLGDDACAALLGGRVCGGAAPRLVPPGAGSFELLPAFVEAWPRYGWGLALLLELLFGPDWDEVFYASLPAVENGLLSEWVVRQGGPPWARRLTPGILHLITVRAAGANVLCWSVEWAAAAEEVNDASVALGGGGSGMRV